MQKGDIVGLIIVLVILAGIGLFFAFAPDAEQEAYKPVELSGSAVRVGEQADPQAVHVSAELKQPGFVTVHEAVGEAPGPIVGTSSLLAPTSYQDVSIPLDEPLIPGNDYFVLLFVDDGDGIYEPGIDLPVMSDGRVIKEHVSL